MRDWVAWHEAYDDPSSGLSARLTLLCGIFGNVNAADIARTVAAAPALCAPGATVIWTRHRRPPDLTPQVRAWFTAAGFEELAFGSPASAPRTGVGASVLRAGAGAVRPEGPLFCFGSAHGRSEKLRWASGIGRFRSWCVSPGPSSMSA